MSSHEVILRLDATYPLSVEVGDAIHQGRILQEAAPLENQVVAPLTGTVRRIRFEPESHEFVITIEPLS